MTDVVVAASIAVVVAVVALVVRRRQRTDAPTQRTLAVPSQIDRRDFGAAGNQPTWLVAVFTSTSCHVCADVWDKVQVLASSEVAVFRADYESRRDLHLRYGIEAVPATLVCDGDGVVLHQILGPVSATDLWAAVARVRDATGDAVVDPCERES